MESVRLYVAHPAGRAVRWIGQVVSALLFGACLAVAGTVLAGEEATTAVVERVQWPAWVESAGRRLPLAAGQSLAAEDTVLTGDQARLVIRLPDGSAVKLGERARLRIAGLAEGEPGVMTAGLEVARGAFRFTTGLFRQLLGRRQIEVRMPTLTIGVRGTDFWGRTSAEREMVLLLEGSVSYARPGGGGAESGRLATPMNYLQSDGGGPLGERTATAGEVAGWAQETEVLAGQPLGRAEGGLRARILSAVARPRGQAALARLAGLGFPARLVDEAGRPPGAEPRYSVVIDGLTDAGEATVLAGRLRQMLRDGR